MEAVTLVVSFAAVFRLITQRSSTHRERNVVRKKAAVCGEEHFVTRLKTAAKETMSLANIMFFSMWQFANSPASQLVRLMVEIDDE